MKKDVIIAVLIGFALGAIVAIMIVNLPSFIKNGNDKYKALINKPPPTPSTNPNENSLKPMELTVIEPKENTVNMINKIKLLGKTESGSIVFLDTPSDSISQEASKDGSFIFDLTLNEGNNELLLSSYTKEGNSKSINFNTFYTPEKL
jgi:hypothetical protein